jgi:hypothetical protein
MKKFAIVMLAAVVAVVCSGSAFAADPAKTGAQAYTPDADEAKYITELVSAKLLTSDVYNRPFYDYLTKADFAAFAMTYYRYLGGQDPVGPGGNYIDTADPNADKGYLLGFFGSDGGYFHPDDYVNRGEALTVLAKATVKADQSESSKVPTAEAALAALGQIYQDAASIDAESLPYIGFMNVRGALLMPRGESPGNAYLGASNYVSRGDFFLYLSDAAWIFAKSKLSPHAIKPDVPTASEYQGDHVSCYKDNVNLYWNESQGAYSYGVSLYVSKKLKKKLSAGYASLNLNKTSAPTYKSVFGNLKQKKACYLKVRTVDRHGVKSKKSLKINFYAEKFVNVNEKIFGNKNRFGFKNAKAAKKYQKTVKVKVWKLSGGKKVKSSVWLTVNKEIADDVKKIFAEIYKGKEKFPVRDIGGFQIRSSKTSEHNHGTAIDINANENCMKDGDKVVAGKFWKPGKNPYSIKPDGDVVKAFEKYGWYWGGNGWPGGRKDYMHFSYFHT